MKNNSPYGQEFKVGDRVAMSRLFLHKLGGFGSRVLNARGIIREIKNISVYQKDEMATVEWKNGFQFLSSDGVFRTCNLVRDGHLDKHGVDYNTCDTYPRY